MTDQTTPSTKKVIINYIHNAPLLVRAPENFTGLKKDDFLEIRYLNVSGKPQDISFSSVEIGKPLSEVFGSTEDIVFPPNDPAMEKTFTITDDEVTVTIPISIAIKELDFEKGNTLPPSMTIKAKRGEQ